MKKTNIIITFEQEKVNAILFYAGKKDASLMGELTDYMEKLYEKYVPAQTREYIESQAEPIKDKPKPQPHPTTQNPTPTSKE